MTRGMSRDSGKELKGIDHLRQSITDILTTPVGTRVWRRDYGSRLPRLVTRLLKKVKMPPAELAAVGSLPAFQSGNLSCQLH